MEDVHAIRVYVAVAEELSFTRAGERLNLTQSAVSHQIARLERELGVELLSRDGRVVEVTTAGKALLDHARRVLSALQETDAIVQRAAQPQAISLRVGASATACQFIIPEALREFRACYPTSTLSIQPGDSPEVIEQLQDGTIDLGLMIRTDSRAKLTYHRLFEDDLGVVVSRLHPWAHTGKIARPLLADEKLVLYSRGSTTYRLIEKLFARWKLPLRDSIELGSIEAIKELVKLGLGITFLAKWVCQTEIEEGSLAWLPLPGPRLQRQWTIATIQNRNLAVAEQTFIGLCQAAAGTLLQR